MAKTDTLQGSLDLLVLKVLSRRAPLHGYAIAKRIKELSLRFAGFVKEARDRIEPPKPVPIGKFKKIEDCEKE